MIDLKPGEVMCGRVIDGPARIEVDIHKLMSETAMLAFIDWLRCAVFTRTVFDRPIEIDIAIRGHWRYDHTGPYQADEE